ncbi:S-layer homology domain-containing protein [Petrocella sp. FN5]|uniref:S-layer homology domain-containing protein n=1 Tax=Petrocella sp. FN5 TaxID=3032002 RepID=UPI0023DA0D66|nr:S-layer homology domain-containing protein [Petrocella sp. FN5]MDF1617398.1 S-layer homology domain-containing protein [Petrocella sp. FN5]
MRISNREKILLTLVLTFITLWMVFVYAIEPQMASLKDLKQELRISRQELQGLEKLVEDEDKVDQAVEAAYVTMKDKAGAYFNTTPQEEIILLLNDFLLMPFITEHVISFDIPVWEEVDGIAFKKDVVHISYTGQYASLLNMLKSMWSFPKHINMTTASIVKAEVEEIEGDIQLEFYTFATDLEIQDDLYKWYVDDLFYKENPFSPSVQSDGIVRYLYMEGNSEVFNFSRYFDFTDIAGHYMEAEIQAFLEAGHLYLNPYLTFEPDQPMTRGEFIVLMDKVYDWPVVDSDLDLTTFDDYEELGSLENAFAKAIHRGYLSGFIVGYEDNTLRPKDSMTYGEVEFVMNKIKPESNFTWTTIGQSLEANKSVPAKNWSDPFGVLTKAEAVYLLYYFR